MLEVCVVGVPDRALEKGLALGRRWRGRVVAGIIEVVCDAEGCCVPRHYQVQVRAATLAMSASRGPI